MPSSNRNFTSWIVAAGVFAAAALFGAYELRSRCFTNGLLARNEAERTLNLLLNVARTSRSDDAEGERPQQNPVPWRPDPAEEAKNFAEALDGHPLLKERVLGLGAYGPDGSALFRYGTAPEEAEPLRRSAEMEGSPPRIYLFDRGRGSLQIYHPFPVFRGRRDIPRDAADAGPAEYVVFYELKEEKLYAGNAAASAVFALWLVFAAAGTLFVRSTLVKNAQYRDALRAQRELVALGSAASTLAHEIKNPLGAIRLQADLIGRLVPGAADRELAGIRDGVDRIRLLVERIGDFLREPGGIPERLDLGAYASQVLSRIAPAGGSLPLAVERPGLPVLADPPRLRSVIENVARNAYDAGGPPEGVDASVREEGRYAVLEIRDRGTGLPPAGERERIFDPFYTTKTRGFGLGLALSRRFVEAAGGTLTLEDREGGGATAKIALPKAEG